MFDIKEFMEQVVKDNLIRPQNGKRTCKDTVQYFNEIQDALKEYDKEYECRIFEEDSRRARNHLLDTLDMVIHLDDRKEVNVQYEKDVFKDLSVWLNGTDIMEYDVILPDIFALMVCLGFGSIVCEQIEAVYQFCQNDEKLGREIYDIWRPAYEEDYMEFGDYCLFSLGDAELGMRFYYCAAYDWYDGLEENIYKKKMSEKRKIKLKQIKQNVFELNRYYNLLPMDKLPKFQNIDEEYNRYLRKRNRDSVWAEELLRYLFDFVKVREKRWKKYRFEVKRILLIISHRLLENGFIEIISELLDKGLVSSASDRLVWILQKSQEQKLMPMQRIAEEYRNDDKMIEVVAQLAKTLLHINEILAELKVNVNKKTLAYYTSLDTFCYMLPDWNKSDFRGTDRFSVMNIAYMNDPNEGKALQNIFQQLDDSASWSRYISGIEGVRENIEYPYVFMKCFTSLVDDLPMWEMYGDQAKGCCIVLDTNTFLNGQNKETPQPLYQVCYIHMEGEELKINEDKYDIEDALNEICDIGVCLFQKAMKNNKLYDAAAKEFLALLDQIRYLFKNSDYEHEQEVRLLYVYSQIDNAFLHTEGKWPKLYLRPDFPIKMKEIIIGPKCTKKREFMPYLQEQIAKMCIQENVKLPKITASSIHYQ